MRANEYFAGWKDHPPVYVLVKALMQGLGGGTEAAVSPSITDRDLSQLAREAGPLLPILHDRDPGLPPSAPIFDLDVMRKRNEMRKIRARS